MNVTEVYMYQILIRKNIRILLLIYMTLKIKC